MRLPTRSFVLRDVNLGLLGLMTALLWLASTAPVHAQVPTHFFKGEVFIDGHPAEEGTRVSAHIDGVRVGETSTRGGVIVLGVPQEPGEKHSGKAVEFRGRTPDDRRFIFPQTSTWHDGGETRIKLILGGGSFDSRTTTDDQRSFDNRLPQEPFKIFGKIRMNGRLAPNGTRIEAFVDGVHVGETKTRQGTFELFLNPPPPPAPPPNGRIVEFGGTTPDGKRFDFHETLMWNPGEHVEMAFEVPGFQQPSDDRSNDFRFPSLPVPQITDGVDMGCVLKVLGRIPAGPQGMSPQEALKVAQNCRSDGSRSPNVEDDRERLKREQAFQEEQDRLDKERLKQDQERLRREREIQAQQDLLDQDRLKSERARQAEQARLDRERMAQEQERIKAEQEIRLEQQRLDQRRAKQEQERQDELEKARFESERARIDRERALDEDQRQLEQERNQRERERMDREFTQEEERLRREVELNVRRQELEEERLRIMQEGGNPPPLPPLEGEQRPFGEEPEERGPTRGFFSNTTVGNLGTANNLLDPAKLAVIGIVVTLGATLMQMVRGN